MAKSVINYTEFSYIDIELRENGVLLVTLNRPDTLNALNEALLSEIGQLWPAVADDPDVRVVVVTGAGETFSVGGDISLIHRKLPALGLSQVIGEIHATHINWLVRGIGQFNPIIKIACRI